VKYAFITQHKNAYPISLQCQVLGVSRSGYYYYRNYIADRPKDPVHQGMLYLIKRIAKESGDSYGYRRMREAMNALGFPIGDEKTRRLMREAKVVVRRRKKFKVTTNSNHKLPVFDNLPNREFTVLHPDRIYAGDATYIWT
jgi:putative transposase